MPKKVLKFELPVGAVVGGFRHLGAGVFTADLNPLISRSCQTDRHDDICLLLEGKTVIGEPDNWPTVEDHIHTALIDDPLEGKPVKRHCSFIAHSHGGKVFTEAEWPDLFGVPAADRLALGEHLEIRRERDIRRAQTLLEQVK